MRLSLEDALDWIVDDEWIEITPKKIRVRKRVLESNKREASRKNSGS
jgi:GTP-binding protein